MNFDGSLTNNKQVGIKRKSNIVKVYWEILRFYCLKKWILNSNTVEQNIKASINKMPNNMNK